MPKDTRRFFESRMGHDFSGVHIINDNRAAETAHALNARAFTLGHDIVFNAHQYAPGNREGKHLLAHELTHVVQQNPTSQPEISSKLSGRKHSLQVTKVDGGVQRIMREEWGPQPAPPPCSSSAREVSGQLDVQFGPVPADTENCVFTPLFHVAGGTSSVSIQAQAVSPPAGDWRMNVFECPWRTARGNECRHGRSDNAAAGPISDTLNINYDPVLWVSRNLLIRIRNGSTRPIQNVRLTLRPRATSLDSVGEIIHAALDALGLVPALGIVPDALNAGFYLIEGDWVGAGISAAAMVPIFGQGAGITRLGVRVSRESIERLGREGVERAIREGVERAGTRVLRRAPPERIIAAMRRFRSRIFRAGSETFHLDSRGMQHILERHHPRYWDGSVRQAQSFFSEHLSVDGVADAISAAMRQNREQLIRIGANRQGQITGVWGGITYVLGLNRGRVGQFYPL